AAREDAEEKIELLADGQQFVTSGIHPDTGKPYSWFGGEPGKIKHEDLPYISEQEARQLVANAAALLKDFGYTPRATRPEKKKANGSGHNEGVDEDSDKGGRGPEDWVFYVDNIHEGRELHDSLLILSGKLKASGMSEGAVVNFLRGLMQRTKTNK